MEKVVKENPELIIKSEPTEFVEIYSDKNEISSPHHPQIIINQAWSINGVPSHFICIKNVKVTKDAIIIDVVCDIEKNEDADACKKTQKVIDSSTIKTSRLSEDILKEEEEEKFLISENLKQEPIDDSFALKDFEEIGDSINNKGRVLSDQDHFRSDQKIIILVILI